MCTRVRLPALVYDILLPKRKKPESDAWSVHASETPNTGLQHTSSKEQDAGKRCLECARESGRLEALAHNILPLKRKVQDAGKRCLVCARESDSKRSLRHTFFKEEDAGKRCLEYARESNSQHWFTTYFLQRGRYEVPESDAWSVHASPTLSTGLRHTFFQREGCRKAMRGVCTRLRIPVWGINPSPLPSP